MVSENQDKLQQVEERSIAANLNNRIRHSEGVPVYITDAHDVTLDLMLRHGVDLEQVFNINQLSQNMDDLKFWFSPDKSVKASDSPVIFLLLNRNTVSNNVMKIINASYVKTYYQDANYKYKGITERDPEAIRNQIREQYQQNFSAAASLDSFRERIQASVNQPPISTGFTKLDSILNGGLHEGIISVGAITSLGKTTFCMQIADHIAESGHDVMIFSLEMSKNELISKSISRITYETVKRKNLSVSLAKTQLGITDGCRYQRYNSEEKKLIDESIEEYKNNVAQHLYIYESVADMTVKQIGNIIEDHYNRNNEYPIVIIDYLQLLQHEDKYINSNDKLRTDVNITSLKRISRKYRIPIIAISSFNRSSYNSDNISLAAFKESGGIEYSSDIIITLQQASERPIIRSELTEKVIKLSVLKNRQGKKDEDIELIYQPAFNHYEEG